MSSGEEPTQNFEHSDNDSDNDSDTSREPNTRSDGDGVDPNEKYITPQAPSMYDSDFDEDSSFVIKDHETVAISPETFVCPFGKYRLVNVIGQGGAGIVYRAESLDPSSGDESFAIKFLRPEILSSRVGIQRFRKESRLHAEIVSPYVTRHFEFGQFKGSYFIVSEFVDGVSVSDFLSTKDGETPKGLPQRLSLLIVRNLLQGLSSLHQAGIVHRDVKPGNLIAVFGDPKEPTEVNFRHAKLTDFGLARHIEQSESLEMTRQQTILGTPLYMAPEQYSESRSVDARADIYSVGATLFHLIAGRPPLEGENVSSLADLHRIERPVALSKILPEIGDALSGLVAKALEKSPEMRYQDAADMLDDVEQILENRPISLRVYPEVPNVDDRKVKKYEFEWKLNASSSDLWPLIIDTNRFNKAIGLPLPVFTHDHSSGTRKTFATAKFNGMTVRWREHPFQWIHEREMSVLREFSSGPFEWMTSTVELAPLVGKQTRVIHKVQVKPRGLMGRLLVPFQFKVLTKRSLEKAYLRIEQLANDVNPLACDLPFGKPIRLTQQQEQAIEDKTRILKRDPAVSEYAERIGEFVRTAADPQVARICPIPLSRKLNCETNVALNICLSAVAAGMFNLSWDVICPVCRVASETQNSLSAIKSHAQCDVCNLSFEIDFAQSVELVFSVHPSLRTIKLATYCIGGPYHAPHIIAQNQLKPGEQVDVAAALAPGPYGIRSRQLNLPLSMMVQDSALLKRVNVELGNQTPSLIPKLSPGNICIALENKASIDLEVRIEKDSSTRESVSAAEASTLPMFQKLFPNEKIKVDELVDISSVYVLMISLIDSEQRIEQAGDLQNRADWNAIRKTLNIASMPNCQVVEAVESQIIAIFDTVENLTESLVGLFRDTKNNASSNSNDADDSVPDLSLYGMVIHSGQIMTGYDPNQPGVFGKAIRETKRRIRDVGASEVLICREVASVKSFRQLDEFLVELAKDETESTRYRLASY